MAEILWAPTADYRLNSTLWKYKEFIENHYHIYFENYNDLHRWSIDNNAFFWESIVHFFEIDFSGTYETVIKENFETHDFIGTTWFDGINLSYAEHIFKQASKDRPALKYANEHSHCIEISWEELQNKVSSIQQFLLTKKITKGDRICGVLNNTIDTIAVFLAVNSLGAIWSCCSPDFGDKSIADRFIQIQPKILFIEQEYQYNNKVFSKTRTLAYLQDNIPSITAAIAVNSTQWNAIFADFQPQDLFFQRVSFSHPLWILYSSGTTGIPKAITHGTGGILVEHMKALVLHQNVQRGDNFLWYSTTGWMMWNYSLSSLLCGATLCLFDGIINHDEQRTFWHFLKTAKVDHLGAGAAYYSSLSTFDKGDFVPKVIASTGSPLSPETFTFLQHNFPDTPIISLSGGTDVCSAFLSGCAMLPVYAGQLQCITLGSAIEAFNEEGTPVINEVGELVITKAMPSMPICFWNDTHNTKYKDSYFDKFSGVWAHGDWIKINPQEGIIIYGRSDATLNRDGVRIGTAEIYNTVQNIQPIKDSLVITEDMEGGQSKMILFVQLQKGIILDDQLVALLKSSLRLENSPRHIPDFIYQVQDIPYTLSGKKLELPIKRIFAGVSQDKAVTKDIMRNPDSLSEYVILKNNKM